MVLALAMDDEIVLALEELCALDAVELTETWQIFSRLFCLEGSQVFGGAQIGVDQIKVSGRFCQFQLEQCGGVDERRTWCAALFCFS